MARRHLTPDQAVAALALANKQPPRIRTMPDHPVLTERPDLLQEAVRLIRQRASVGNGTYEAWCEQWLRRADPRPEPEASATRQEGPWTAASALVGDDGAPWTLWRCDDGYWATKGTPDAAAPPRGDGGLYSTVASLLKVKRLREVRA